MYRRSEDNYHVASGDQTQAVRLGGKPPYPQSYPANLLFIFLKVASLVHLHLTDLKRAIIYIIY